MVENVKDKIRGVMVGEAIGDALGFPVRRMTYPRMVDINGDYDWCPEWGLRCYRWKTTVSARTWKTILTTKELVNAGLHRMSMPEADTIALEVARKHLRRPQDFVPVAVLVHIIYVLIRDNQPTKELLIKHAFKAVKAVQKRLPEYKEEVWHVKNLIKRVVRHYKSYTQGYLYSEHYGLDQLDSYRRIMEIVGEERTEGAALAIALFGCLSYWDDFPHAMITVINHDGDSCAAASMAGSIMGAVMGLEKMKEIAQKYVDELECYEQMVNVADELCRFDFMLETKAG